MPCVRCEGCQQESAGLALEEPQVERDERGFWKKMQSEEVGISLWKDGRRVVSGVLVGVVAGGNAPAVGGDAG